MALDDENGEAVAWGTWLYGGTAPMRVAVAASTVDRVHWWALEEIEHVRSSHGTELEPLGAPRPMGPDGVMYHIQNTASPDFDTIEEAKAWADAQPWGPVRWSS
jgi:hypothetical protein